MKVLFAPQHQRTPYFVDLLAHARKNHGWEVGVVSFASEQRTYDAVIEHEANFFAVPDFTKPAGVDRDPAHADEIDALIGRCERATDIAAGRIILAAERDLGRGLGLEHYYQRATRRKIDLTDTEALDPVLRRAFAFARDVLDRFRPDIVIGGQNATLEHRALFMIAEERGLPIAFHRMSKLAHGKVFWTRRWDLQNERAFLRYEELAAAGEAPSSEALATVRDFRNKPVMIDYIQKRWDASDTKKFIDEQKFIAISAARQVKRMVFGQELLAPVSSLIAERYRRRFLEYTQQRYFKTLSAEQLAAKKYVYLPMHKEPEIATNLQAPEWRNQKNLVALLSAALPYGYQLLVREHRFNRGRRPTRYYRDLVAYPNVVLIDALDSQFKYLQNAEIIVTDNGSSGWEGLIFAKKVIQLAEGFYSPVGLTARLDAPKDFPALLLRLIREPVTDLPAEHYDAALARLYDAEYETTVTEKPEGYDACLDLLNRLLAEPAAP